MTSFHIMVKATVGRQGDGCARSSSYVNMWTCSSNIYIYNKESVTESVNVQKRKRKRTENATAITGQLT